MAGISICSRNFAVHGIGPRKVLGLGTRSTSLAPWQVIPMSTSDFVEGPYPCSVSISESEDEEAYDLGKVMHSLFASSTGPRV